MSDSLDLDAIEQRANDATEGPWRRGEMPEWEPWKIVSDSLTHWEGMDGEADWDARIRIVDAQDCLDADVDFIIAARSDVPALVAEVRRLREQNNGLRSTLLRSRASHMVSQPGDDGDGSTPILESWRYCDAVERAYERGCAESNAARAAVDTQSPDPRFAEVVEVFREVIDWSDENRHYPVPSGDPQVDRCGECDEDWPCAHHRAFLLLRQIESEPRVVDASSPTPPEDEARFEKPTHQWNGDDEGHDCRDCPSDSIWKCDRVAHDEFVASLSGVLDDRESNPSTRREWAPRIRPAARASVTPTALHCENCGKTMAEHDALAHCWPASVTPTDAQIEAAAKVLYERDLLSHRVQPGMYENLRPYLEADAKKILAAARVSVPFDQPKDATDE